MDRDDIIRMAREAGFEEYHWTSLSGESELDRTLQVGEYPVGESVFKFANLVAAAEREACARHFDENTNRSYYGYHISSYIRSRGQNGL